MSFLSSFKVKTEKTGEISLNTLKLAIFQIVNTFVLLVLVNTRIKSAPDGFPIFSGSFGEMNHSWHRHVGVCLIITMILGTFTPHLANSLIWAFKPIRRCYDRKWTKDARKTRQIFQKKYIELYLNPEMLFEERLANTITIIFTCIFFGAGEPLLYFVAFVSLMISYWMDKWALLRFYKTPVNFSKSVVRATRQSIYIAIIFHLGISYFMFSNREIFDIDYIEVYGETVSLTTEDIYEYISWFDIFGRTDTYQILVYYALMIIFFLILLLLAFCSNFFKIFQFCNKKMSRKATTKGVTQKGKFSNDYFSCLNKDQLISISSNINEDLKMLRKQKNELLANIPEAKMEDKEKKSMAFDWLIARLEKRNQEVLERRHNCDEEGMKDHSYDFRQIFPYQYYYRIMLKSQYEKQRLSHQQRDDEEKFPREHSEEA